MFARYAVALSAACCLTWSLAAAEPKAQDLLSKVPASASVVIQINVKDFTSLPIYQEMRKSMVRERDWTNAETELAKYGLTPETCVSEVLLFGDDNDLGGALIYTGLNESNLEAILQADPNNAQFVTETIKGRKVFEIPVKAAVSGMIPGAAATNSFALTYLEPNLMMLGTKDSLKKSLENPGSGANKLIVSQKSRIPKDTLVWLAFNLPPKAAAAATAPANNNAAMPVGGGLDAYTENVTGGTGWVSMSGAKKDDLTGELVLDCKDAQSATMLAMQAKTVVMGALVFAMQDKPQLASSLNEAIKIASVEKCVKVGIKVPKALQDEIKKYAEEASKKQTAFTPGAAVSSGTTVVPATVPQNPPAAPPAKKK
ncbi:MAG: hypothetical protein A2X49_06225 [Lentisphaerae bacterium GWF2_52_8]|nr:MAG: hypothetical protein A2X49_06225 [Lentisphaerae bacterium GWF2_52_8]